MIPALHVLKAAALGALGVALMQWLLVLLSLPRGAAVDFGARGVRRRRALARLRAWRWLELPARWLGQRVGTRVPARWLGPVERLLRHGGYPLGLTAPEFVGLSAISFGLALGLSLWLGNQLGMGATLLLVVGPVAAILPSLLVHTLGAARLERIQRAWPHALELLALAVSAGSDLPGALRELVQRCVRRDDELVLELEYLLQELQLGLTRTQALRQLADRIALECVAEFVSAVIQAEQRGSPLCDVLRTQATAARGRQTVLGEEAASRASVQMVVPLFLVFLCILCLVLGPAVLSLSLPGAGALDM